MMMRLSHNDGHTALDPFLAGQVGGEAHNRQVSEDSGLGMGSTPYLGIIPEDMDTDLDTTLTENSMQQVRGEDEGKKLEKLGGLVVTLFLKIIIYNCWLKPNKKIVRSQSIETPENGNFY